MAALTRASDYYIPVVGINTARVAVEIAGRWYPFQGGDSFAVQPPVPADKGRIGSPGARLG